jgi:hypothetical protein
MIEKRNKLRVSPVHPSIAQQHGNEAHLIEVIRWASLPAKQSDAGRYDTRYEFRSKLTSRQAMRRQMRCAVVVVGQPLG